jgi:hypothetical protein
MMNFLIKDSKGESTEMRGGESYVKTKVNVENCLRLPETKP